MQNAVRNARLKLLLLAGVFLAPLVAASYTYFVVKPKGSSYGELLTPIVLPDAPMKLLDGAAFRLTALHGKWVLVSVDGGGCGTMCRNKLYSMRQARLVQGKDQNRIERVWFINNAQRPLADVLEAYQGTFLVDARANPIITQLPANGSTQAYIYLLDPLGNLILRYPDNADPAKLAKDLRRLLMASLIG